MQQLCHISGHSAEEADMLRFVRAPDGGLTLDLAGKLPGETLWVGCRSAFVRALAEQEGRDDLVDLVEKLLRMRLRSTLGLAKKAGDLITGFTKVEAALMRGELVVLLAAADGAADGRQKLAHKARRDGVVIVDILTSDELGMALGLPNVIHAGATNAGWATHILKEGARLTAYLSGSNGMDRSEDA